MDFHKVDFQEWKYHSPIDSGNEASLIYFSNTLLVLYRSKANKSKFITIKPGRKRPLWLYNKTTYVANSSSVVAQIAAVCYMILLTFIGISIMSIYVLP